MKQFLSIAFCLVITLCANAQSALTQQYHNAVITLTNGLIEKNTDSIRYAATVFEKYENIFNKDSHAAKQIVDDPWEVFRLLALAYETLNDANILRLLDSTARPLYHKTRPSAFDDYYSVVSSAIEYLSQPQQPKLSLQHQTEIRYKLSHELHDEAIASGMQSFTLSTIKSMVANAEGAIGNTKEAIRWHEDARETGKPYLERERGSLDYYLYLSSLSALIQLYTMVADYTSAITVAEQLSSLTSPTNTSEGEFYLQALCAKAELSNRAGNFSEIETIVAQIDSALTNQKGASQMTIDYARQISSSYHEMQTEQYDFFNNTVQTKEQLANDLAAMEANPNADLYYYNSTLYQYISLLLSDNKLQETQNILEKAERHINQKYANIPYATRVVENLYGALWMHLGNIPKSLKHMHKSEQMFELAADHSMLHLMAMFNFIDILRNANDLAYTKLYLDKIKKFFDSDLSIIIGKENEQLVRAMIPLYYYQLGYSDISTIEISQILSAQGQNAKGSHWDVIRLSLASILAQRGDYSGAERLFKETLSMSTSDVTRLQAVLGLVYANCYLNNTAAIDYFEVYEQAIRQLTSQVMESFDVEGKQSFWNSQTQQLSMLSNLVLHKFGEESKARELAYNTSLYVRSMQDRKSTKRTRWKEVKKMLNDDEVAIEFVTLTDTTSPNPSYYSALVLRKDYSSPKLVNLCSVVDFDNIWRDVIHTDTKLINRLFSSTDTTLYSLVWSKITPLLKPNDKVYYATIGNLTRMNHNIISNGQRQIGDIYTMRQVWSTADIAQMKKKNQQRGKRASIYGGLEYEETINQMVAESRKNKRRTSIAERTNATMGGNTRGALNDELKGTLDEAIVIDKVLKEQGYTTSLITDTKGNEESFKSMSGNAPDILHIGTHGFMINTTNDNERHFNIISSGLDGRTGQVNLMLYCGLRMAGSNAAWRGEVLPPDIEDGILTAYEISQTDLSGCQLVVLSACESGLGFCNYFGTSIGLIRALKSAGVETIIASLWEVPDKATSLLMQSMFTFIAQGLEAHEALSKAQQAVRNKYPDPYYWAAFFAVD